GAVIIHKDRIRAARCILPVSENDNLPAQYGLRHRAAVGMSEITDTLIVVVSEETGEMSVAENGVVSKNLSSMEIRARINEYLSFAPEILKGSSNDEPSEEPKETTDAEAIIAFAKQAEKTA
ncbi:Diadenylate cyclase spyDAC; Bacterial checkpoint controller DisA with nucleotide-binding domain, partial [hydrothermal vent metagenome]